MDFDVIAFWDEHQGIIVGYALRALGALFVLLIGLRVAGSLAGVARNQINKRESIDRTLGNFFASLVQWALTAAVFITVLGVFGVDATSFVAVLGALTLAIGLSMQGALGNIASGVMIMLFRPYKLGDYIEAAGVAGTVKDINLFQTVLATTDNVKIIVPNSEGISGVIKNFSGYELRRCDVTFGIDYDDNMDEAISIIRSIIEKDGRILSEPAPPFVKVTNLGDSSVDIATRSWVKAADYWDVKFDLTKTVKAAFDEHGVSIPYPHTTLVRKSAE